MANTSGGGAQASQDRPLVIYLFIYRCFYVNYLCNPTYGLQSDREIAGLLDGVTSVTLLCCTTFCCKSGWVGDGAMDMRGIGTLIADTHVTPFLLLVAATLVISFSALFIRHRLTNSRARRRNDSGSTHVWASLFSSNVRYNAGGPTAEFIAVLATISFIVLVFWIALNWKGVP